MAKMTKITVLCLIVASACLVQFSLAAPMLDNHEANEVVDEIIMKLKQLKLQGEGKQNVCVKCVVKISGVGRKVRLLNVLGDGQ